MALVADGAHALPTASAVSASTVARFEALWDKLPSKEVDAQGNEFLPTALSVQVLQRSNLPRDWLKEVWSQSRAGSDSRGVKGLDKQQFVLACILSAVCKQQLNGKQGAAPEFPWSAVTEAMVAYSQLTGRSILGVSEDFGASTVSFPDVVVSAPPATKPSIVTLPPTPVPPPRTESVDVYKPIQPPPTPSEPLPLPPRVINAPKRSTSINGMTDNHQRRPVPPPPLPERVPVENDGTHVGNPFNFAAAEVPGLSQLLSDEDLARRLQEEEEARAQQEEEEELNRQLTMARIASEADEAERNAAREREEADRRRAMELEDEEFARRLQAEEEAMSQAAASPTSSVGPEPIFVGGPVPPPRPFVAPSVGGGSTLPSYAPDASALQAAASATGGIAFQFFPTKELVLPPAYGRTACGVKRTEYTGSGQIISEDIYIQYGPRDRDIRAGEPLLYLHFFFNDAEIARRCREAWPRKSSLVPGVYMSGSGFRLPMPNLESATKGFEVGGTAAFVKRRQHFFVIKRAGDPLSETMLSKLNMIVSEVIRDPSAAVSLLDRTAASNRQFMSAPRPNSAVINSNPSVTRANSMPGSRLTRGSQAVRDVGVRPPAATASREEDPPPPYTAVAGVDEAGGVRS